MFVRRSVLVQIERELRAEIASWKDAHEEAIDELELTKAKLAVQTTIRNKLEGRLERALALAAEIFALKMKKPVEPE